MVSGWLVPVDARRVAALRRDARFTVADGPGSSMWLLELRWDRGPLADRNRRAAVAAAIDREELVRVAAAGLGDASTGYVIVALGGERNVEPAVFLRDRSPGDKVRVDVLHAGETQAIEVAQVQRRHMTPTLRFVEQPTPAQLRIREGWLTDR